jgi:hypothetical protein
MKFLGIFRRGDLVKYSVNFHDDANTTVDPTGAICEILRPDDVDFNVVPAKIDGKTGWYGGSFTPDAAWPYGVYQLRVYGTVSGHEVATILAFQLVPKTADDNYIELLQVPKKGHTVYYLDAVGGNDANAGTTPATAKQTLAGVMAVIGVGDILYIAQGTYDANPNTINCQKCEIFMEAGVEFVNTAGTGNALEIVGNQNVIHANFAVAGAPIGYWAIGLGGPQNKLFDMITQGGTIGYSVDGDRNELYNCKTEFLEDVSGAIGFRISQMDHKLERCIARCQADGFTNTDHIGFQLSTGAGPNMRNMLLDCHTMWAGGKSFEVQSGAQYNSIVRCSRMASDGAVDDQGTGTSWSEFSKTSQIATGNSIEQDRKDIYDGIRRIPQEQAVYYVNASSGNDGNGGLSPDQAKATITAALGASSSGDMIIVEAGAYLENVDVNTTGVTIIFKPYARLREVDLSLLISGDWNRVVFEKGSGQDPVGAPHSALKITGDHNEVLGGYGGSDKAVGPDQYTVEVTGYLNTVNGFKINRGNYGLVVSGLQNVFKNMLVEQCSVKGVVIGGAGEENTFENLHTRDCPVSYEVELGADKNSFINCSKSSGDGDKVDAGTNTSWVGFQVGSKIASGNPVEQDAKDVYDRIPSASIADYKADVSALALEANVEGHVTSALGTYDPPTKAEMDAGQAALAAEHAALSAEHAALPAANDAQLSGTHGAGAWEGSDPASVADAVWDEAHADHQNLDSMGGIMRILKAFSKYNIVYDEQVYSDEGNLTEMRIRLFDTAVAAAAATKGGTGEGEFAVLTVTGTYNASNLLDFGKVVKQ